MITTNLSTRPFYNERAVRLLLLLLLVVAVAATAANAERIIRYSRSDTALALDAAHDEARAADLRAEAARLRASVDPRQIALAATEARQANELIDRRTFSWTELFNYFEATLPDDVRIAAVRPKLDPKRGILLTINVVARTVDDVDRFMEELETTGVFVDLLTVEEHFSEQALLEATVETSYAPASRRPGGERAKQP